MLRGLTIDDPVPGRSGCNGLVAFGDAAVSGYYWIWIEFIKLRVYCDMVTDGVCTCCLVDKPAALFRDCVSLLRVYWSMATHDATAK